MKKRQFPIKEMESGGTSMTIDFGQGEKNSGQGSVVSNGLLLIISMY
jgi:hypothetical protein